MATLRIPIWPLQEAKNRLSELIQRAETEGPQTITRHGTPVAVVAPVMGAGVGAGESAWALLRDDTVASLGGLPDLPRRVAEPSAEAPLPW